jgi:hypothetical protein
MEWIEPLRALWDERLDRLDAHLRRVQEDATDGTTSRGPSR